VGNIWGGMDGAFINVMFARLESVRDVFEILLGSFQHNGEVLLKTAQKLHHSPMSPRRATQTNTYCELVVSYFKR